MSIIKLMMASMTVRERVSAVRAPLSEALTASENCWLVARAMYLGMLAVEVAARSAALQLANRSSLALAIAFLAASRDDESRKATKMRDMIG